MRLTLLAGLSTALVQLVRIHSVLGNDKQGSKAIVALTRTIAEKAHTAEIDHGAEWALIMNPGPSQAS